ncbi:hypothetical protein SAPIO_CDS4932 [Scedosporium apiospermum]|uniref:Uncharacterized protein n=1 Tax=Pseudallescheria apiosperma TaxID=563466 RepID=A0A084G7C8_PSEDA|nr:uncharacterized protein SAPIO_CDS4932 [Scedosporium apiospermum]KEZ43240.1 hypothetical protein SAPIO_CDS4932 [Scedosporium apiospermum]
MINGGDADDLGDADYGGYAGECGRCGPLGKATTAAIIEDIESCGRWPLSANFAISTYDMPAASLPYEPASTTKASAPGSCRDRPGGLTAEEMWDEWVEDGNLMLTGTFQYWYEPDARP